VSGHCRCAIRVRLRLHLAAGVIPGLLRLRVGDHRVLFDETADTITVHRVRDRRDAYR